MFEIKEAIRELLCKGFLAEQLRAVLFEIGLNIVTVLLPLLGDLIRLAQWRGEKLNLLCHLGQEEF